MAHGSRCRLGGGSSYVSAYCHVPPPPGCQLHGSRCRLGGGRGPVGAYCSPEPTGPGPEEAELAAMVRQARVCVRMEEEDHTEDEAAAQVAAEDQAAAAEREAERRRWESLTCRQVDAELAERWRGKTTQAEAGSLIEAELAERVRAAQEAAGAALAAGRSAAMVTAPPEPADQSTVNPALSAQRPQERPSGVVVPLPTPDAADPAQPRRRRRRVASVTSINTYGLRDNGYNDPFRGDY